MFTPNFSRKSVGPGEKEGNRNEVEGKNRDSAPRKSKDPLHGITLETILTRLVESHGWEELGKIIDIKCFTNDPSIKSSLKFLRNNPWARTKVERLFLKSLRRKPIIPK